MLRYEQWLDEPAEDQWVTIAIANSRVCERLAQRCQSDGVEFLDMRASNVVVMDDVHIGLCVVVGIPARPMAARA